MLSKKVIAGQLRLNTSKEQPHFEIFEISDKLLFLKGRRIFQ